MTARLLGVLFAICASTACAGETRDSSIPRQPVSAAWDTVFFIGGSVSDSILQLPRLLAVDRTGLYVYDYGSSTVKAFDRDGQLQWAAGRAGSGPGEFRNAVDIGTAPDGSVWVLDGGNGRVAVLDSLGNQRESFPITHASLPQRLVLLDTVTLALLLEPGDHFFGTFSAGAVKNVEAFPVDTLPSVDPYLRIVVSGTNGSEWAAATVFDGRLFVYNGRTLICAGILRQAILVQPGQRASGQEMEIASAIAVGANDVWVLGIDRHDRDLRYLDEYDLHTCTYRRSLQLPVRGRKVAYYDSIFYVEFEEPAPAIVGLRPRSWPE